MPSKLNLAVCTMEKADVLVQSMATQGRLDELVAAVVSTCHSPPAHHPRPTTHHPPPTTHHPPPTTHHPLTTYSLLRTTCYLCLLPTTYPLLPLPATYQVDELHEVGEKRGCPVEALLALALALALTLTLPLTLTLTLNPNPNARPSCLGSGRRCRAKRGSTSTW